MKHSLLRDLYRECREFYYLFTNRPHGLGYILMLHRIGEPNPYGLPQGENLKVSILHLDRFITEAKKKFDIIRLEDVPNRLKEKHKRKFLVFTFDDGYKEVLITGLPIFRKHNVPFTVFLTTGFMEKDAILWWDILERTVISQDSLTLSNGQYYSLKTRDEKVEAFNRISSLIKNLNKDSFAEKLAQLFKDYEIDWFADTKSNCLEWSDVSELLAYPLFTLGSHTCNHFKLDSLKTDYDVENEIFQAVKLIKEKTGHNTNVFAYPYGAANNREFKFLRSLQNDITLAVLAHGGPVTCQTSQLEQLPRINFDDSVSVKDLLHSRNVYMGF